MRHLHKHATYQQVFRRGEYNKEHGGYVDPGENSKLHTVSQAQDETGEPGAVI